MTIDFIFIFASRVHHELSISFLARVMPHFSEDNRNPFCGLRWRAWVDLAQAQDLVAVVERRLGDDAGRSQGNAHWSDRLWGLDAFLLHFFARERVKHNWLAVWKKIALYWSGLIHLFRFEPASRSCHAGQPPILIDAPKRKCITVLQQL